MKTDDSALVHGRVYDPQKAREYYLRTRKLKGRRRASPKPLAGPRGSGRNVNLQRTNAKAKQVRLRQARRRELEAEKARLEQRVKELAAALKIAVAKAKKRAGVKTPPSKQRSKAPASKTKTASTSTRTSSSSTKSKAKPLTSGQKREKAKTAREQYRKEQGLPLNVQIKRLRLQVKDIRSKLEKAVEEAKSQSGHPTKKVTGGTNKARSLASSRKDTTRGLTKTKTASKGR